LCRRDGLAAGLSRPRRRDGSRFEEPCRPPRVAGRKRLITHPRLSAPPFTALAFGSLAKRGSKARRVPTGRASLFRALTRFARKNCGHPRARSLALLVRGTTTTNSAPPSATAQHRLRRSPRILTDARPSSAKGPQPHRSRQQRPAAVP